MSAPQPDGIQMHPQQLHASVQVQVLRASAITSLSLVQRQPQLWLQLL